MRTRPIGNKDEALAALRGELRLIGEGFFRKVYVNDANTIVYKVAEWDDNDTQIDECENYWRMRQVGIRIARPYRWNLRYRGFSRIVIAMRYYNGPRDHAKVEAYGKEIRNYVADALYYNKRTNTQHDNIHCDKRGRPILIDLQFFDHKGLGRLVVRVTGSNKYHTIGA